MHRMSRHILWLRRCEVIVGLCFADGCRVRNSLDDLVVGWHSELSRKALSSEILVMSRHVVILALLLPALLVFPLLSQQVPRYAGPTETGYLLPNGWTLT